MALNPVEVQGDTGYRSPGFDHIQSRKKKGLSHYLLTNEFPLSLSVHIDFLMHIFKK